MNLARGKREAEWCAYFYEREIFQALIVDADPATVWKTRKGRNIRKQSMN